MKKLRWNKPALAVGVFVGILHTLWAIYALMGLGESLLDWIFPLNFINHLYTPNVFDLTTALLLTAVSFVISYLTTLLFVWVWKMIKVKQ